MKLFKLVPLAWVVALILGFYGIALGEGGFEDPTCDKLPDPKHGPFIKGEFTVALDKSDCSIYNVSECAHYNLHAKLKHGNQTHLISFLTSMGGYNICTATASQLKELYKRVPCSKNIGGIFGYPGIPVIADMSITETDFCSGGATLPGFPDVPLDAMIAGEIVIRVVPVN